MQKLAFFTLLSVSSVSFAGQFVPADQAPIDDQYIVVLKDKMPSVKARKDKLNELAKGNNGVVTRTFEEALNGGVIKMPAAKAKGLANNPHVALIEQDRVVQLGKPDVSLAAATSITQSSLPSWGLDRIDQRKLPLSGTYNYANTGLGVTAYVIDSGIRMSHADFGGNARFGFDAFADGLKGGDCNGHGTHVAGTIAGLKHGVAKNASVVSVRVLDCNGSGSLSGVIAGVDWVSKNAVKPAVANMSLGGGTSTSLDNAVKNSIAKGITYVVAAGNSNVNACNASPARVPEALTVGATTSSDARASYSNFGSCLDLFAPGSSIRSAWYTGDTATATSSGTSMAAPHVAGVVALYLQSNPVATPATVSNYINNNATTRLVTSPGTGSPNRLLYSLAP